MKILSWNCQGLGNPWTVRSLRDIVRVQAPTVCFLMETRLDKEGFDRQLGDLPFPNKIIVKQPNSGGGLALIWRAGVQMELINFTMNHILVKVTAEDGFVWFLTGFYGWPEACQRGKSWALLNHLRSFVDGPWVCIGDFNAILNSSEKLSNTPPQQRLMDDFRQALDMVHLFDLGFEGYPFTWNNRRPGYANTKQRLDRAVGNEAWRAKFCFSKVTHLSSYASDHLPIVLHVKGGKKWQGRVCRGFKFEEAWLLWDDCEAVVEEAWGKGGVRPNALETTRQKIETCGADLLA
ncbi:uncharacterized protein LOC115985243 [Quercus lobata]|uniref:uncharacterized protein LOC115985243 n=1 Tax=Quercus lobata TaxID=97700 RepID=UPI0012441645|nr:uncharacterized protein LOC115985243 [Quercus lobata]